MRQRSDGQNGWREALLALLVLSLVFLNFGQSNAVFAAGGRVVFTGVSVCGDHGPLAPGQHSACHGCRQDVPALPPAPAVVEPVVFVSRPAFYPVLSVVSEAAAPGTAFRPRGPPKQV